jgi:hypothetical protein
VGQSTGLEQLLVLSMPFEEAFSYSVETPAARGLSPPEKWQGQGSQVRGLQGGVIRQTHWMARLLAPRGATLGA